MYFQRRSRGGRDTNVESLAPIVPVLPNSRSDAMVHQALSMSMFINNGSLKTWQEVAAEEDLAVEIRQVGDLLAENASGHCP